MSSDDASDSDAPEDVPFSIGRTQALHSLGIAKAEKTRQQQAEKERRRKRHAQFKEQKERKFLSHEVLKQADAELKKKSEIRKGDIEQQTHLQIMSESSDDELRVSDAEESGVAIAVIDGNKSKSLVQSALEFKTSSLYGKRIKRVNVIQVKNSRIKKKCISQRNAHKRRGLR